VVCASIGVEIALARVTLSAAGYNDGEENPFARYSAFRCSSASEARRRSSSTKVTPHGDADRLGAYVGIGMASAGSPVRDCGIGRSHSPGEHSCWPRLPGILRLIALPICDIACDMVCDSDCDIVDGRPSLI
jgi:hypothetical protein